MLRGLLLWMVLPLCTQAVMAEALAPAEAVTSFLALDAAGARLRSTASDPIWKLTIDNGEPPELPIVLVQGCRVTGTMQRKKSARVRVLCTVTGTVADDGKVLSYRRDRRVSKTGFTVLPTADGWKISLNGLLFPPHVARSAYIDHLNALIRLYRTDKDKADPRYRSLLATQELLKAQNSK